MEPFKNYSRNHITIIIVDLLMSSEVEVDAVKALTALLGNGMQEAPNLRVLDPEVVAKFLIGFKRYKRSAGLLSLTQCVHEDILLVLGTIAEYESAKDDEERMV